MRSSDNVRSRANSQNRSQSVSQGHPAELTDSTHEVGRFPEEYPEPEETIFLQIVGFLLEVKALPVSIKCTRTLKWSNTRWDITVAKKIIKIQKYFIVYMLIYLSSVPGGFFSF